jgi:hypothetical protein
MSTKYNGMEDYAIVFNEQEVIEMYKAKFKGFGNEQASSEEDSMDVSECGEALGLHYESEFTGEVFPILEDGSTDYRDCSDNSYTSEPLYYLTIRNYPTLFKGGYASMDELVEDMRTQCADALPEDINVRERLRHIIGTYYG